jgi:hypothetical protein
MAGEGRLILLSQALFLLGMNGLKKITDFYPSIQGFCPSA